MLTIQNLTFTLNPGTPSQKVILKNLNLHVHEGESVAIIGGNGAGKSTLFKLIAGSAFLDKGNIVIDGSDVTHLDERDRSSYVAQVVQDPRQGTLENMTIFENLALAFKRGEKRCLIPFTNKKRSDLFKEHLKMLQMNLEKRMETLVGHLSGGERQALSLVMATLQGSKILLLDEITAALDPKASVRILDIAKLIVQKERRTCLMITHHMQQAIDYASRILVLKDGRIAKEFLPLASPLTPSDLIREISDDL